MYTFGLTTSINIDGIAIRSQLGLLLAGKFLTKLEKGSLERVINKCYIYRRYVKDIYVISDSDSNIQETLSF